MWLDVCFHPVQPQTTEHNSQHCRQGCLHVAAARKRSTDVVAEVCTLEPASDDLAQLDRPNDHPISVTHDEPTPVLRAPTALEEGPKGGGALWWGREAGVEAYASPIERDVLRPISRPGWAQRDAAGSSQQGWLIERPNQSRSS